MESQTVFLSLCFHTHILWVWSQRTRACACAFKCICRAAVCFEEGLMTHLWPSTTWHGKDWANIVLIISCKRMRLPLLCMLKWILQSFSVSVYFAALVRYLPLFFNSLWHSLENQPKSWVCAHFLYPDCGAAQMSEFIFIPLIWAQNHQSLPVNSKNNTFRITNCKKKTSSSPCGKASQKWQVPLLLTERPWTKMADVDAPLPVWVWKMSEAHICRLVWDIICNLPVKCSHSKYLKKIQMPLCDWAFVGFFLH